MSDVEVRAANRVRLVAAVLAASDWPACEQAQCGTHAVHPHAKLTRQYVREYDSHPAVQTINTLLPDRLDLSALFSTALRCTWPTFEPQEPLPAPFADGRWAGELADFYVETAVAAFFWADHAAIWAEAERDLRRIFNGVTLHGYLARFRPDGWPQQIVVVPNLVYPAAQTVIASNNTTHFVILPPPKAVGESPPWPYRDGADWVLAESCYHLLPHVLSGPAAKLNESAIELLRHAATAVFLEQQQDEAAALFYTVRCKKEWGLPHINEAAAQLRAFLSEPAGPDLAARFAPLSP